MATSKIEARKHSFGTSITMTIGSDYTALSDGYIRAVINPSVADVMAISLNGVLLFQDKNPNNFYLVKTVYVRKGMTCKVDTNLSTKTNISATFVPIV